MHLWVRMHVRVCVRMSACDVSLAPFLFSFFTVRAHAFSAASNVTFQATDPRMQPDSTWTSVPVSPPFCGSSAYTTTLTASGQLYFPFGGASRAPRAPARPHAPTGTQVLVFGEQGDTKTFISVAPAASNGEFVGPVITASCSCCFRQSRR